MAKVQFFKGTYEQITGLASRVADGIYVATDRPFIFVGDQEIGIDGSVVKTFEWNDASNALKVSYVDGSEKVVVVPVAAADKNGLMSKEDFSKLANINANWFGTGHVDADRIAWTVDISTFASKDYVDAQVATKIDEAGVLAILDSSLAPYAKTEDVSANFVAKNGTDRLMTADEGTKLAGIAAGAQVNVVEGIADGEKVISLDSNKKLKSTLTINYDSSSRKVQLKGIDSSLISEFDASEFVKDGMLFGTATGKASADGNLTVTITKGSITQSKSFTGLTPNHQYLVFCFTDGGAEPSYDWQAIDVNHLVDVYKAGVAIEITTDNSINVKVADASIINTYDLGRNFLEVEDNELVVKGVDADCTETVKSVEVNGGPLSSMTTNWPWQEGGKNVVPANLSMQDFITGLFLKVINGTLGTPSYSWNVDIAKPTCSISPSTSVLEVGTEVTMVLAASEASAITNNVHKVTVDANSSGMYGYMKDEVAYKNQDYTQSQNGSVEGTAVIYASWTPNGESAQSVVNGDKKNVVIGSNSLTGTTQGLTVSCPDLDTATIYALTNTGVKVDSVSRSIVADHKDSKELYKNNSASCTGVYPVYYGLDNAPTKAAIKNDTTWEALEIAEVGTSRASFAYPAAGDRTVAVYVLNTMNNTYEAYAGEYDITDITKTINGADYAYKLWKRVAENNNGTNKYKIVLSKKTSE